VFVYICMVCMNTCMYIYMNAYMYASMYTCMYSTHVCNHVCMHIWTHICTQGCTHLCRHVCKHVRMYCMYVTHLPACPGFPVVQFKALQGVSRQGPVGKPPDGILVYGGVGLGCVVVPRGSASHLTAVVTVSVIH